MSKVITFSRVFPSYHPKAGQPTFFVEKIVSGLVSRDVERWTTEIIKNLRDIKVLKISDLPLSLYKHHTIRTGHRFKVGDKFSPRVWSGMPYRSPQITIGPDIQIKKTWDFDKDLLSNELLLQGRSIDTTQLTAIAKNDGLSESDLLAWFNRPFTGQIICWNETIEY